MALKRIPKGEKDFIFLVTLGQLQKQQQHEQKLQQYSFAKASKVWLLQ